MANDAARGRPGRDGVGLRARPCLGRLLRAVGRARPRAARCRLERRRRHAASGSASARWSCSRSRRARCAVAGTCCATTRGTAAPLRRAGRSPGPSSAYFSADRSNAGRPGDADRAHRPRGRRGRGCGCVHGQRPGRLTLAGAGVAARRPRARPRPGVRRRPERSPACCGRSARWSAARRTSSSPPTTAAASRRSPWPAAAWPSVPSSSAGSASSACYPCTARPPTRRTPATTVPWWLPLLVPRRRQRRTPYTAGVAASRAARLTAGRRSSASTRSSPASCGRGCCSPSSRGPIQLVGGLLILAGVMGVKLGERTIAEVTTPPVG